MCSHFIRSVAFTSIGWAIAFISWNVFERNHQKNIQLKPCFYYYRSCEAWA